MEKMMEADANIGTAPDTITTDDLIAGIQEFGNHTKTQTLKN